MCPEHSLTYVPGRTGIISAWPLRRVIVFYAACRSADASARRPASHGVPRYESATTQAAAVSTHVTRTSPHWKLFNERVAMAGTHTSAKNSPICNAESAAASRAHTPMRTATPAVMNAAPVKYTHATCAGSQLGTIDAVCSTY